MMYLILALITGILVKLTDKIIDEKKKILFKGSEIIFGAIYGALIGVMISSYPIIAPLWIGVVLGVSFTKKIDHLGHTIAIIFAVFTVYLLGFNQFSLSLTIVFFVACVIEELVNNYIDRLKEKNFFIKFMKLRPIVEFAALVASIVLWRFELFFAILSFDIGYVLTNKVYKH